MTLTVTPYKRGPDGELKWLPVAQPHNDLAGSESARTSFWGSKTVSGLGCNLLSDLTEESIFAEGPALVELEKEIEVLSKSLKSVVSSAEEIKYWKFRLANVEEAIRVAKLASGGVCIQ